MTFLSFMSGLFAVAKALPIVAGWIDDISEAWTDKKIKESDSIRNDFKNELKAINGAIEKAETDEEIISLSIIRSRLKRGELPNAKNSSRVL